MSLAVVRLCFALGMVSFGFFDSPDKPAGRPIFEANSLSVKLVLEGRALARGGEDYHYDGSIVATNRSDRPLWCLVPLDTKGPEGSVEKQLQPAKRLSDPIEARQWMDESSGKKLIIVGLYCNYARKAILLPPHGTVRLEHYRFLLVPDEFPRLTIGQVDEIIVNEDTELSKWIKHTCLSDDGAVVDFIEQALENELIWNAKERKNSDPARDREVRSISFRGYKTMTIKTERSKDFHDASAPEPESPDDDDDEDQ